MNSPATIAWLILFVWVAAITVYLVDVARKRRREPMQDKPQANRFWDHEEEDA